MARRNWADIPVEWLLEIIRRLPCRADRQTVGNICTRWREALRESQPPPAPLPWLLLTSAPTPTLSCVLSKGEAHELVGHHAPPPARYFGSYEGTWVLAAYGDPARHLALNLTTGARIQLPNRFRDGSRIDIPFATFSSDPDAQSSLGASVVKRGGGQRAIFWRRGDTVASVVQGGSVADCSVLGQLEDVVFFNDEFFFLTSGGDLRVCAPVFTDNGDLQGRMEFIAFPHVCDSRPDYHILTRYLVASRNKLLLVARYTTLPDDEPDRTAHFGVFEMAEGEDRLSLKGKMCGDGLVRRGNDHKWHQLPALDGRILFVGHGCSRAYEASQYPGLNEGIYFTDDYMFVGEREGEFFCDDSGRWSATHPGVEHIFTRPDHSSVSTYSCPIWVLPPGLQSDGDRRNLQERANLLGAASNTSLRIEDGAGSDDEDAGSDDEDAGSGDGDAGSDDEDAGSDDNDAGSDDEDAGSGDEDAGSGDGDAGSDDEDAGSGDGDAGSGDGDAGSGDGDAGSDDLNDLE